MITGHLERDKDKAGRPFWRIRFDYGVNPVTGKREQPRAAGYWYDRRQAAKEMAEQVYVKNHGPRIDSTKQTTGEIMMLWLKEGATGTIRDKTYRDYESVNRNHIQPELGHVPVQQLTTAMIQAFRSRLIASGKSTHVAKRATLHLSQGLTFAVQQGILSHNPAKGLKQLKVPHTEMQVWDAQEASQFLAAAKSATYDPLWLIALSTGMRQGELLALRWADVDLDNGTLAVRRSVDQRHKEDAPKSGKARTLHLAPNCIAALKTHRTEQKSASFKLGKSWKKRDLVFASESGDYLSAGNIYRVFRRLITDAKVKRIRFHDMRHTSASLMLEAGIPVKVVSECLGHSTVSITLDIYAHVLPGMGKLAAETLGKVLTGSDKDGRIELVQ